MSSESNPGILYVVRDVESIHWFELMTAQDALLLVEDGVYRQSVQLPSQIKQVYALSSDVKARAAQPNVDLIDHGKWVTLSLQFSSTVRL